MECANYWQSTWHTIQRLEFQKLEYTNDLLCENLNKKLNNLRHTQTPQMQNNETQTNNRTKFYPRIKNLTNTKFNKEEQDVLKLGLNYAIEKPTTHILQNLIIDTENAIKQLNEYEQNIYRHLAYNKIKQIKNTTTNNILHKRQLHIMKQIRKKLTVLLLI